MIVSIEWPILYHDCVSVIVSRFTIFTEDLVICCYQVTKIFSTRYSSTSAHPARSTCNLGSLAHFAISVLTKSRQLCPAVTMYLQSNKKNRPMIVGQRSVHNFPGCIWFSVMFLYHWPTHRNIHNLRRVFPVTRLQACPRGSVVSRINQSRKRILSLPHSFALLHRLW